MNQQIVDYIKRSRSSGVEENAIRQALLGSGFSVQEIEEAAGSLNAEKDVLDTMLNKKPMFPADASPESSAGSKIGLIIKIVIIGLVVVVGFIGGYFALTNYFPQYAGYLQPYLGPVLDPIMNILPFGGGATVSSPTPVPNLTTAPTLMPSPTITPPQVTDTDNDGLSNVDELKYGTNPNNPDTDGDGYPDGEEVQNGYNPLGPGKAVK